ncbi:hypothetical protein [Hydrogenovibrio marinus]|uniref:Uncharacterized protein n=1 Tax=Hydrogenovibrio marinus TaxID=28885 RepID=A0A066ZRT3_HYDMR|nr:hypothetical protein [Hydrogenovibrio marinus]KDN96523.1 hypothetical protein EI16_09695 [Hydrogenovibrio marinus]BBN60273.1 hypothetical protein HVMH_1867 [Hydrogenovibrio marinus]
MENLKPKDWEQSQSNNQFVDVEDVYEEEDHSALNAAGFMTGFIVYFIVYAFASGGFDMEYFFLEHIYAWIAISVIFLFLIGIFFKGAKAELTEKEIHYLELKRQEDFSKSYNPLDPDPNVSLGTYSWNDDK